MKKLTLLLASLLVFTGCKYQVPGDLNVTAPLKLGKETYQVGSYNAKVGLSRTVFTGRYKLLLDVESSRGSETHKFKAPKGMNLPRNGHFTFTASQLKQPYGLDGDVSTQTTDGARSRRRESCSYQEPYTVCRVDNRGRRYCHTEYRIRYGYRDVEYQMRTVDQDLSFDIVEEGNSIANFNGSYHDTYAVNTWEGRCW